MTAGGERGASRLADDKDAAATKDDFRDYLCRKVDQLLTALGSKPLDASALGDREFLDLDPVGTIADSFARMLENLHCVNERLQAEIDERKRAEEALREKEERFRTLAEFSSDWAFWRGPDGEMLYVAPACEQVSGYAPAEFYESPGLFASIVHPDDRESWNNHVCAMEAVRQPGQLEVRIVTRQGETRWINHLCRPVFGESGQFLGVRGSNSNITERKRSEKAFRESEEQLRDFFDNAMDLIQSVSPDGRFRYVNRAWRELLGYTEAELARLSVFDVVAPDCKEHCQEMFRRIMSGSGSHNIETTFVSKDGRRIVVEGHVNLRFENGKPVASRGIFRDVTDRRRMEEELRKANTLDSIGILAGGIAHDFNNILTAIMGYISLAKMDVDAASRTRSWLVEAEKASGRAQALTRQLLTFAKGGAPIKQQASIAELIEESAAFALRGSNVRCRIDIAPDLSHVDVDPTQIGQMIGNVVLNAGQSMPDGGIVRVAARNLLVDEGSGLSLPAGSYVRITVEDDGVGIPEEHLPKIFNPFFSTKAKGTGLGLATSYSIVRRHDGAISVDSRAGSGTTISVFLPVRRREAPHGCGKPDVPAGRNGKVLVMDDEDMVREVALRMLEAMGYRGFGATDGTDAVRSYRDAMHAGEPFDAVILDLTVPGGVGGKEAVTALLEIDPDANVIVSSGYSHDPVMSRYAEHGFRGVIAKPYQPAALDQALRSLIRRERAPEPVP
jgi:PAS domain S-box-containing protein